MGVALKLWFVNSVVAARASVVVAQGLSSCGEWTYLYQDMWNLPVSGIVLMSLALAGGFFTTGPPGKPEINFFKY